MKERDQRNERDQLADYLRETALLNSAQGLLGWDQETYMPDGAAEMRADQQALLAGMAHHRETSDELAKLIESAGDDPMAAIARDDYERRKRIPNALARERVKKCSLARQAWIAARKTNDFAMFRPHLEGILDVMNRWAEALGYEDEPYDALLQDYETGETVKSLDALLAPIRKSSSELWARILDSGRTLDPSLLKKSYPTDQQAKLGKFAAAAIGFDFKRGRLDITAHPFCSGMSPDDVRLTTRYDESNMADSLYSTLHEAGHGIYEQGLPSSEYGNPFGDASSMGAHESQSRLWENHVLRSRAGWEWLIGPVSSHFPTQAAGATPEDFYRATNDVRPNLIRVDADEVTYDLHICIRFELERAMLSGELAVKDLPAAWNERYRELIRIDPPTDSDGCLQDVHWSAGLFGYFPTYSLGNIYAAHLFQVADRELGGLNEQFASGNFRPLKEWLNEKIHRHGRRGPTRILMEQALGEKPSPKPMQDYLEAKFSDLYEL